MVSSMVIKRLCKCGSIVGKSCSYCDGVRQTKTDDYRGTNEQRGYGSDWARFARRYKQLHPLCESCLIDGKTSPAVDVHHIVKLKDRPELRLDENNVMSVCRACHKMLDNAGK